MSVIINLLSSQHILQNTIKLTHILIYDCSVRPETIINRASKRVFVFNNPNR